MILTLLTAFSLSSTPILGGFNSTSFNASNKASTINYDFLEQEEILNYYSTLEEGQKGDELLDDLQAILSENQVKVNYTTGFTQGKGSKSRLGYYLYERNWDLSPLEESEKNGDYKTSDVWLNVMYVNSPIYIENSINNKSTSEINYKFYPNYPDTSEIKEVAYNKNTFDREHVFPKSYGFNGANDKYKDLTAGCDAHNLHIATSEGNQQGHSNYPYGNVVDKEDESTEVIKSQLTGDISGYLGIGKNGNKVFEPLDKDKGDIARSIFYMAARYHNYEDLGKGDETPALALGNNVDRTSTKEPSDTKNNPGVYGELDDLLAWNKEDPVTEFERQRNDLIYNNVQYNRNPFVDFPSWADACFDAENSSGITFDMTDEPTEENPDEEKPVYTFKLEAKNEEALSYHYYDKFDSSNFVTTLESSAKARDLVVPSEITYYLGENEIKNGDMITTFGSKEFYAVAKIDGQGIKSNTITLSVTFSTMQIIIGLAIILGIIIIFLIIFFSLSKTKKKKMINKIKKGVKKK